MNITENKRRGIWEAVSAVAAAVAALAALATVWLTVTNALQERESQRPFLAISNEVRTGIVKGTDDIPFRVEFHYKNVGLWPADDFQMTTFVFDREFLPLIVDTTRTSEILAPMSTNCISIPWKPMQGRLAPQYFVFTLSYKDIRTGKTFYQEFFMKLPTADTGIENAILCYTSADERQRIQKFLNDNGLMEKYHMIIPASRRGYNVDDDLLVSLTTGFLPFIYALIGGGFVALANYLHERKVVRNRKRLIIKEIELVCNEVGSLLSRGDKSQWMKQHLSTGIYLGNQGFLAEFGSAQLERIVRYYRLVSALEFIDTADNNFIDELEKKAKIDKSWGAVDAAKQDIAKRKKEIREQLINLGEEILKNK